MTEEIKPDASNTTPIKITKRDIFRVNGANPSALNLDHVTMITLEDKRITFAFQNFGLNVDLENAELASIIFEQLLTIWAGDVLEDNSRKKSTFPEP